MAEFEIVALGDAVTEHLRRHPRARLLYDTDATFHQHVDIMVTTLAAVVTVQRREGVPLASCLDMVRAAIAELINDRVLLEHVQRMQEHMRLVEELKNRPPTFANGAFR